MLQAGGAAGMEARPDFPLTVHRPDLNPKEDRRENRTAGV